MFSWCTASGGDITETAIQLAPLDYENSHSRKWVIFCWWFVFVTVVFLNLRNDHHTCWTIIQFVYSLYVHLKFSGVFKRIWAHTSAIPMQCSNQLGYEATQMWAGQLILFGSCVLHERNDPEVMILNLIEDTWNF